MTTSRDWMADARCAQVDPEVFFPKPGGRYQDAQRICAACPVRQQCAEYAAELEGNLAHSHRHGTWGGAVPRARAKNANGDAGRRARRDEIVLRLASRGMHPSEIGEHAGCTERTVWRVLAAHRDDMETAA